MSTVTLPRRGIDAGSRVEPGWIAWAVALPVLAAIAMLLWWQADPARILEDTLQHIGVARNVLRGQGLQTSLLYYDVQYAPQVIPAPQTVWPPGMPLAIAALALLGLDVETGALLLAWLSFIVAAVLLVYGLKRAGVSPVITGLAAVLWMISSANWMSAAIAASELPYVACLLASTAVIVIALTRERHRLRLFALAGLAAACAIGVRYLGVVFVAAAGFVIFCAAHVNWRQRFAATAAFGAMPAAVAVTLMARNLVATGHLSGGQFGVAQGVLAFDALLRAWWSTVELLALPRAGATATVMQWGLLGLLGLAAVGVARVVLARFRSRGRAPRDAQAVLLGVSLAYCGATVALHLVWAVTVFEGMLDSRYFEPLLPFAFAVVAIAADDAYRRYAAGRRFVIALGVVLCVGYALLQWQHWRGIWADYASVANDEAVARALATPFAGETAGEWLASNADIGPIVGTLEHALHANLDRPVLGLPWSRYSTTTWDDRTVSDLMTHYGSCIVFFVPGRFEADSPSAGNLPFFRSLAAGEPAAWLDRILSTPDLELYGVTDDRCRASMP